MFFFCYFDKLTFFFLSLSPFFFFNTQQKNLTQVGAGAMIGPRATVLGNIKIGENSKVASAALVLREVPAGALAAGSPASIVGCVNEIGWDL